MTDSQTSVTQTRTFVYNTKGQLTSSTTPEKGTVTYAYQSDGLLASKTENTGSKTANPIQTKTLFYFYDTHHRLIRIESPSGTVKTTFTYDTEWNYALNSTHTTGRMTSASNDGYTWHYSYDLMGRATKQTLETPVNGGGGTPLMLQSQYGFDNDGRMTDLYYPGGVNEVGTLAVGQRYQYAYDILSRVTGFSVYGGATLASTPTTLSDAYTAAGQIRSWTEGSTNLTRAYDPQRGWVNSIAIGSSPTFQYSYNASGQVTSIVNDSANSAQSAAYTYDNLNRLSTATTPSWGLSWSYDDFGNRTSQTATLGSPPQSSLTYDQTTNQITNAGYTFDAGGNLTAFPNTALSGTPTTSVVYDVFDRAATITTGSNSTAVKYDAFGRRIQQTLSGGLVRAYFYSMSGQLLAEYDTPAAGNTPTRIKNYFAGQIIGHWTDRTGSKRADVGSTSHYYPYGEEITNGTANDTYKFAQLYRDADSGLDYANSRYYASSIGRFLSVDHLHASLTPEAPQTWNRYSYGNSDPVNSVDPGGKWACSLALGDPCDDPCDPSEELCSDPTPGPPGPTPSPQKPLKQTCGQYIQSTFGKLSANQLAAVEVMLAENSWGQIGKHQYLSGDTVGSPTGPIITEGQVDLEDQYMADVLLNRAVAWGGTVASQAKKKGQFDYAKGVKRYQRYIKKDSLSTQCQDIKDAIMAFGSQSNFPEDNTSVLYWVGMVQGSTGHLYVRKGRPGDIQFADTAFSSVPFQP